MIPLLFLCVALRNSGKAKLIISRGASHFIYLLTDWEGGMGKYFVQVMAYVLGPCAMTKSQIF